MPQPCAPPFPETTAATAPSPPPKSPPQAPPDSPASPPPPAPPSRLRRSRRPSAGAARSPDSAGPYRDSSGDAPKSDSVGGSPFLNSAAPESAGGNRDSAAAALSSRRRGRLPMEGHGGVGYRDFFSQPNPLFGTGDFYFFSQPEIGLAGGGGGRRHWTGKEPLDLNSQLEPFSQHSSYQASLHPGHSDHGGVAGNEGLPPPGVRGGTGRSSKTKTIRAPCPSASLKARAGRGGGRVGRERGPGHLVSGGSPGLVAGSASVGRGGTPAWYSEGDGGRGRRGHVGASSSGGLADTAEADTFHGSDQSQEDDEVEEADDDEDPNLGSPMPMTNKYNKANWTTKKTILLCNLCVEQARSGNCAQGTMSSRGYQNLAEKFFAATGLRHSKKQFKNQLSHLKKLYKDWLWLKAQTGGGCGPNGEAKRSVKKFRSGPPPYIEQLRELFHGSCVDSTTGMTAGDDEEDAEEEGDPIAEEQARDSPVTSSSRKRTTSNCTTGTSPVKKSKSPMVKALNRLVEKWADSEKALQQLMTMQVATPPPPPPLNPMEALEHDIRTCQQMAVECGAASNSMEYFVASNLFEKPEHRIFFRNIPNKEDRLLWLQRWGRKMGLM
ncbi:hypothetical protein ACP4OV_022151 [Aristida adscensionis]